MLGVLCINSSNSPYNWTSTKSPEWQLESHNLSEMLRRVCRKSLVMLVKHPVTTMGVANCLEDRWATICDQHPVGGNNSCGLIRGVIWFNSLWKRNRLCWLQACQHVAVRQCSRAGRGWQTWTHSPWVASFHTVSASWRRLSPGLSVDSWTEDLQKQSNTLQSPAERQTHKAVVPPNRNEKYVMARRWGEERHRQ